MKPRIDRGLAPILIAAAAWMLLAPVAQAADAAGAEAFLRAVYSHYPSPAEGRPFNPTGRSAARVFDPTMVALFREDERLAHGEVGAIDADPLCQCQDDGGMQVTIGRVRLTGPSSALADVVIRFPNAADGQAIDLELDLVTVKGLWRIHDIRTRSLPSLRAYLAKANHDHRLGRW